MNTATIARTARTVDNCLVNLWSDGDVTNSAGQGFTSHRLSYGAASVLLGEVALATVAEMPALIRAAAALPAGFGPGELRRKAWGAPRPSAARAEVIVAGNQARRVKAARRHIEHCRSPWCRRCRGVV